jgi:hypothetical protein
LNCAPNLAISVLIEFIWFICYSLTIRMPDGG